MVRRTDVPPDRVLYWSGMGQEVRLTGLLERIFVAVCDKSHKISWRCCGKVRKRNAMRRKNLLVVKQPRQQLLLVLLSQIKKVFICTACLQEPLRYFLGLRAKDSE